MSGTPLPDDKNELYDAMGGVHIITTKSECPQKLMHQQVENVSLTHLELDTFLAQACDKSDTFADEIDAAL